jgi:hypothetical protein
MILREAFFRDLPEERQLYDYGSRTDGQPVYVGSAKLQALTSSAEWNMWFFKYDASGNTLEAYSLKGAWDNRVALFLEYV